eukprot:g7433.t1
MSNTKKKSVVAKKKRVMKESSSSSSSLLNGLRTSLGMSLVARVMSFLMNLILARRVDRKQYGVGMVSMELLYSLGCFLLYEGFRRAAIRMIGKDKSGRSSMFVVWIGIATTIVASLGLSTLWFVTTNPEESEQRIAIGLIFVSILIKSFAEPMFISEVHQKRLGTKPVVEGVSQILRSCSLCAMVLLLNLNFVIAYAFAQIVHSISWYVGMIYYTGRERMMWTFISIFDIPKISEESKALTFQILLSAGQKMLLGKGERILLVTMFDEETWGVYALVSNFGSLVLRTVFAPVEGIAYSYFSSEEKKESRDSVFRVLLTLQGTIGFIGLVFGPPNSFFALKLLYGSKWAESSDAVSTLEFYCVFLFFAALNGVFEAYVHAVADAKWMKRNLFFQMFCSGVLCTSAFAFQSLESRSLVVANSICMILRILRCVSFIKGPWNWIYNVTPLCIWITISRYVARTCAYFAEPLVFSAGIKRSFFVRLSIHLTITAVCLSIALWNNRHTLIGLLRTLRGLRKDATTKRKVK